MAMKVEIVSPEELMFEGEADSVIAPAAGGDLGILPGRQPVLAVLRPGSVRIVSGGATQQFPVQAGFVSFDDNFVQVVVDNTTAPEE